MKIDKTDRRTKTLDTNQNSSRGRHGVMFEESVSDKVTFTKNNSFHGHVNPS